MASLFLGWYSLVGFFSRVWEIVKRIVLYSHAHIPHQGHQVQLLTSQKIFNRILVKIFCTCDKLLTPKVAPIIEIIRSIKKAAQLLIYFWKSNRVAQSKTAWVASVVDTKLEPLTPPKLIADREAPFSSGDESSQSKNSQLPLFANNPCKGNNSSGSGSGSGSVAEVELINLRATDGEAHTLLHSWESALICHENEGHISLTDGKRSAPSSNLEYELQSQQPMIEELHPGDEISATFTSSRDVDNLRATEEEAELLLYFWKSGSSSQPTPPQDDTSSSSPDDNLEQPYPKVEEIPFHDHQSGLESFERVSENNCPLSEFGTEFIEDVMNDMNTHKLTSSTGHVPLSIRSEAHRRPHSDRIMTTKYWNKAYEDIMRDFQLELYNQEYQTCDSVKLSFSSLEPTSQEPISASSLPPHQESKSQTATQLFSPFNNVSEEANACWRSIPDHLKTIEHWNAGFNENIRQMQMGAEEDESGLSPEPSWTIESHETESELSESHLEFFKPSGVSNFKEEFEDLQKSPSTEAKSSHWRTSVLESLLDVEWKDETEQPSDKLEAEFTPIPPDFSSHERNMSLCSSIGSSSSLSSVSTQQSPIIHSPTLNISNFHVN